MLQYVEIHVYGGTSNGRLSREFMNTESVPEEIQDSAVANNGRHRNKFIRIKICLFYKWDKP